MLLAAGLLGIQLWLFVWAPLHQRAIDVSLGYFLLPLMMVLVGRVFYRERLSRMQSLAVAVAVVGVSHEVIVVGSLSWVTALVIFGYPPYFMLRRRLRFGTLAGLWFDMLLLTPAAVWVLQSGDLGIIRQFAEAPRLIGLILLLGLISSTALVSYISASRMLPLGLFGILGYVEPVLLFWVAVLLLREEIVPGAWWTYIPIWVAVALVTFEGLFKWLKESRAT
jgi:chloramphenicol-sensitive protein RarD